MKSLYSRYFCAVLWGDWIISIFCILFNLFLLYFYMADVSYSKITPELVNLHQ